MDRTSPTLGLNLALAAAILVQLRSVRGWACLKPLYWPTCNSLASSHTSHSVVGRCGSTHLRYDVLDVTLRILTSLDKLDIFPIQVGPRLIVLALRRLYLRICLVELPHHVSGRRDHSTFDAHHLLLHPSPLVDISRSLGLLLLLAIVLEHV